VKYFLEGLLFAKGNKGQAVEEKMATGKGSHFEN
jgi:hypothetical protein